jgi:hypothetical protein
MASFKPVLWYVKGFRRGRTLMPDTFTSPSRDKLAHDCAQGEGGVWVPIEHLTEPGELIVDPFAGTATWGRPKYRPPAPLYTRHAVFRTMMRSIDV